MNTYVNQITPFLTFPTFAKEVKGTEYFPDALYIDMIY